MEMEILLVEKMKKLFIFFKKTNKTGNAHVCEAFRDL